MDTQAILTVIGRRKYSFGAGESIRLDLSGTCLLEARLSEINLERANLGEYANLTNAFLRQAHLKQAVLLRAHLENGFLGHAHLENAVFRDSLENADLYLAILEDALLIKAHIERTFFWELT